MVERLLELMRGRSAFGCVVKGFVWLRYAQVMVSAASAYQKHAVASEILTIPTPLSGSLNGCICQ